ncbi:MAG: trypsin-like peptidase domain-containing protein, partial [Alphaproteobacteria bacterium]|nr:trypsin-like peptidase domain-containing protein [Alphaproteobacteria bacterium]
MTARLFSWLVTVVVCLTTVLFAYVQADHGPHSFKAIEASVLRVLPTWPGYDRPGFGAPLGTAPEGTGFVIAVPSNAHISGSLQEASSPYLLTAAHVVDKATRIEIISPNGVRADAVLLAVDPRTDLALLKMPFALPT